MHAGSDVEIFSYKLTKLNVNKAQKKRTRTFQQDNRAFQSDCEENYF